jgi:hypothetical protein
MVVVLVVLMKASFFSGCPGIAYRLVGDDDSLVRDVEREMRPAVASDNLR